MKATSYSILIILMALLLASCTASTATPIITAENKDEGLARQALVTFLDDLHQGRYTEATQLYGGAYDSIIDNNPGINPSNRSELMKSACEINGWKCLEVKSATLDEIVSATDFNFKVEFLNADGSLFVRGPCCGGNATDNPPESVFMLTVMKDRGGKFLVMDMPPYVP